MVEAPITEGDTPMGVETPSSASPLVSTAAADAPPDPPLPEAAPAASLSAGPEPGMTAPVNVVSAERFAEGWRTASLALRRAEGGFFLTVRFPSGKVQVIHLAPSHVEALLVLAAQEEAAGSLWRKLSEIPLERPLPSRALAEQLRVLLRSFGRELLQSS